MQGFNPLIPADVERSSIPVAILRFVVENMTDEPVTASICGSLQNFIGTDGVEGQPQENENSFRRDTGVQGIFLHSCGVSPQAEQYGTLALTTTTRTGVTYRTAWAREAGWRDALHDFWDDFSSDGQLDPRELLAGNDTPEASLSVRVELAPRETQAITFLLTWHFPDRQTWTLQTLSAGESSRVGNYYTTRFSDAWEVATRTAAQLDELETETLAFVSSFCASSLPAVVKEAALYNVSTLRTQTCFRTADGYFYGWKGCNNTAGWCHGSCTHVCTCVTEDIADCPFFSSRIALTCGSLTLISN